MPRPSRCRRICCEPAHTRFSPDQSEAEAAVSAAAVTLSVDEYECIRLLDYEHKNQLEAARQMDIARTTVTAIYQSAREKIAAALVEGRPILIGGGRYRLCGGDACPGCSRFSSVPDANTILKLPEKGEHQMRIAVTYEKEQIFQHFGHTSLFKIFDVEDGKIDKTMLAPTMGSGHGALAGFLKTLGVDTLICGGIGGGALNALADAGIEVCAGVSGSVDDAVTALLNGTLSFSSDANCSHHSGEHTCGDHEHSCGDHEHSCGHNCHE